MEVDDDNDSAAVLQQPTQNALKSDAALIFLASIGSTISFIAILSQLDYYTALYDKDIYIYLNLAVFLPLLPIAVLQASYDNYFDGLYSSKITFGFRGHVGYLVSLVCLLGVPHVTQNHGGGVLLVLTLLVGTASGILQGSLRQIMTGGNSNGGGGLLAASVTSGMQASAVFVLVIEYYCSDSIEHFYVGVACVVLACWCAYGVFLNHQNAALQDPTTTTTTAARSLQEPLLLLPRSGYDEIVDNDGEPQSQTGSQQDSTELQAVADGDYSGNNAHELLLSYWELCLCSWKICLIIFVTISTSMAVASWFNRFDGNVPRILFFTRIFADLLGRPVTLLRQPSINCVGIWAALRLLFCPYFFLVVFGILPTNTVLLVTGVLLFAGLSGYIVTICYQVAPKNLPPTVCADDIPNQTKMLNVFFSVSVIVGLVSSLGLSQLQ